jgi:hypothetical protein
MFWAAPVLSGVLFRLLKEIRAVFPEGSVRISQFEKLASKP